MGVREWVKRGTAVVLAYGIIARIQGQYTYFVFDEPLTNY